MESHYACLACKGREKKIQSSRNTRSSLEYAVESPNPLMTPHSGVAVVGNRRIRALLAESRRMSEYGSFSAYVCTFDGPPPDGIPWWFT